MSFPAAARPKGGPSRSYSQFETPGRVTGLAFTLAVFLSAALLFVVEPMFGKMVLPLLGGSPAVWTTCMLFFQGALLLGYLYAHIGPRWLGVGRHRVLHIGLLALCLFLLPIRVAATPGTFGPEHPSAWLIWVLALSLGAPFILLSSTGPLLQVWFSQTSHPEADSPYFLYAASNAGSLLALLSYPFLIEPTIPLRGQSRLWSLAYLALVILVAVSAAHWRKSAAFGEAPASGSRAAGIETRTLLRWILLAFVPSSLFVALTTYVTTDVAAVPLLWIVPLVLYLLSFTLVFGRRTMVRLGPLVRWQPVGLISLAVISFWGPAGSSPWLLPLHLIVLFVTALICHGELAATRPPAARLTEFYLCIAIGGVLGGVFNALLAPALFNSVLEYPLSLLAACAVRPRYSDQSSRGLSRWDIVLIAVACLVLVMTRLIIGDGPARGAAVAASAFVAVICLRMSRDPMRLTLAIAGVVIAGTLTASMRPGILLKERNFFGVREVREDTHRQMHVLVHGTTKHGAQSTNPGRRREPMSFYARRGPVGDVFRALPSADGRRVAVIGLGAGAIAAYSAAWERWVFYEIDPDIARVARDTTYFTYLQDALATIDVILGDGRLSLARAPSHSYDLIVLDAFSSDAIPIHLLTLEALAVYRSKLSDQGVLVFHLSNRYLDLEPVLGSLLQARGISGFIRYNTGRTGELEPDADPSVWAVVAPDDSSLRAFQSDKRWRPLHTRQNLAPWTDDFSNIFSVFRWP